MRNYDQIFKLQVPQELTLNLLDKIVLKEDNVWIVTYEKYKQGVHSGEIPAFILACVPYYHEAKKYYVATNGLTYNRFLTILRQICTHSNIPWNSPRKYFNGTFNVQFHLTNIELKQ